MVDITALESALPAGGTWWARRIAESQAEKLAQAGYVLIHPATLLQDDEAIRQLARAGRGVDESSWDQMHSDAKDAFVAFTNRVLIALGDTR